MFCRNCGTDVTDMKYCPKCGTPTVIENMATEEKPKTSMAKRKYMPAVMGVGTALLIIAVMLFLYTINSSVTYLKK